MTEPSEKYEDNYRPPLPDDKALMMLMGMTRAGLAWMFGYLAEQQIIPAGDYTSLVNWLVAAGGGAAIAAWSVMCKRNKRRR